MNWRVLSLTLTLGSLLPLNSMAAAENRVLMVENEAIWQRSEQKQALTAQSQMGEGLIRTGAASSVQIKLADGSLLALPANSEVQLSNGNQLSLIQGGMRLTTATQPWRITALNQTMRVSGYLNLESCADQCRLAKGVYGQASAGETIVEYNGGRAVLKGKIFRLNNDASRPDMVTQMPMLTERRHNQQQADAARGDILKRLSQGISAFAANDFVSAKEILSAVQTAAPSEAITAYYLGLIALENKQDDEALRWLQKYSKDDPKGALARDVPKMLTLLSTQQLQEEVAKAIAQEQTLSNEKPEANTIAVQTFSSRDDPTYQSMAKGIAAMIIADLSKVPGLKVLEREKVQKLMTEMNLSQSGLVEQSSAVRAGRILRAEKVVVGSFGVQP